jgi:hypothetical protein
MTQMVLAPMQQSVLHSWSLERLANYLRARWVLSGCNRARCVLWGLQPVLQSLQLGVCLSALLTWSVATAVLSDINSVVQRRT